MNSRIAFTATLLLCANCGSPTEPESASNSTSDPSPSASTTSPTATCPARTVPWLRENNFWRVAWSYIEGESSTWFGGEGDGDASSYEIELGAPNTVGDFTLYPLQLTGDFDGYAPLWKAIGTNRCGDIVVSSNGTNIIPVYVATKDAWTGVGFWQQFDTNFGVSETDTMISSQIMAPSTYLVPPFTAVGRGSFETGVNPGSGCDYYAGYGTICGSDDPGSTITTNLIEYWNDTVGPVAFQDSSRETNGGDLKEHEKRIEVYFFADNSDPGLQFNLGPNTFAEPIELLFTEKLSSLITIVPADEDITVPSVSYAVPADAKTAESWFQITVSDAMAERGLLIFLGWMNEAEYDISLYTPPASADGFAKLMPAVYQTSEELAAAGIVDFSHAAVLSGEYPAGTWLIGVRRLDARSDDSALTVFTTFLE